MYDFCEDTNDALAIGAADVGITSLITSDSHFLKGGAEGIFCLLVMFVIRDIYHNLKDNKTQF